MNSENLFLVGLTIVMVTLITTVGIHNYHEINLIAEGIASGGDPLAVSCAYDPLSYCDILTSQTTNNQ